MDTMDQAQYQEDLVREQEIKLSYKKVVYKCELCQDPIDPTSKIKRWCTAIISSRIK